jgi:hypothetical protein
MPKFKRPKHEPKPVRKRLFIVCEGEKTERYYFEEFIKTCGFRGVQVQVKVVKSKRTTPCELINSAIKKCSTDAKSRKSLEDQIWVVYDKDGYSKHCDAWNLAQSKGVEVAFSSISFEFWVLLHFENTAKAYKKSEEIIKHLNKKKYLNYDKSDSNLYDTIKDRTPEACKRAKQLRKTNTRNNPTKTPPYELNPYTNVDELLVAIIKMKDTK